MGELILHIGTTKTGTTSLQRFLFDNRKRLEKHGVCFPVFSEQQYAPRQRNGFFIAQYCANLASGYDPARKIDDLEDNLEELVSAISQNEQTILSNEGITSFAGWVPRNASSPQLYWEALAKTVEDSGAECTTVVIYLRRQDAWAGSQWRQEIKVNGKGATVASFCGHPFARYIMDYAGMLADIERAFDGRARIVVRRYDRTTFEGGDIYHDFCAACGIPWDNAYELPEHEANLSLTFDVAEALRTFSETAHYQGHLRKELLIPLAWELSRQNPDPPGMTPFDESQTRSLVEPYLEGNALVSDRYLDGAPLFSEDYGGRPVWVPDEERIAGYCKAFEKAVRSYRLQRRMKDGLSAVARKLPEGIKRHLKALRTVR